MRINIYSQELTDEVLRVEKPSNTGITYHAVQFILHSSDRCTTRRRTTTVAP